MNRDIEYHIDKHSELGSMSEEEVLIDPVHKKPNKVIKSKIVTKSSLHEQKSKAKRTNDMYYPAIHSGFINLFEPAFSGISTFDSFPMFNDQSQYHYESFNNNMLENLTGFSTSHPLIMKWLMECPDKANCQDTKTLQNTVDTDKQRINNNIVIQKIRIDPDADQYLREIIKTYNALQTQYTNLFNALRDSLIRAGYEELSDPEYIIEPIIINYKSMPYITTSFYDFMKDLKADINRITTTIEQLYLMVGNKDNKTQAKQIKNFYRNVHAKKMPLIPNDPYQKTQLNKNLGDIFNLLGGSTNRIESIPIPTPTSTNQMSHGPNYIGGGGNLYDTDSMISDLRSKLTVYKDALKPWDMSKIHRISDKHRSMLMMDQQNVYETDTGSRSKKIYLDKFDKLDKDNLLDNILERDDPMDYGLTFIPVMETHDLDSLINSIDDMYKDSSEKLQKDNIDQSMVWMRGFINHQYEDLTGSDFTFTNDIFSDKKKKNRMKDALDIENRKEIRKNKEMIDTLNIFSQITDLSVIMAMMFKFFVDIGKITKQKNPYLSLTPADIYKALKQETDMSKDFYNIQTGYNKIIELLPYFSNEGYESLKTTSRVRKIFQNRYGSEDTYFFDKLVPDSRPPKYKPSVKRPKVGQIISANINTNAISYHTLSDELDKEINVQTLKDNVSVLKNLDVELNKTSEKQLGYGLFPGGDTINKAEFATYFQRYIESTEKLLNMSEKDDVKIDSLLNRKVALSAEYSGRSYLLQDVKSYLKIMNSSQNFMRVMGQHFDDYSNIELMVGHIHEDYVRQIAALTENMTSLEKQLLESSEISKEPVNEQLVIENIDMIALRLEIKTLVDLLIHVDEYETKLHGYDTEIIKSYSEIEKNALLSYNVKFFNPTKETSLVGGLRIEGVGDVGTKIEKNQQDVTTIIDKLFNKITHIEDIKRGMGDVGSILKNAFDLVDIIQSTILFTLNILQTSISSCSDEEPVCKIKMIKYIEYRYLINISKVLKKILSSAELMSKPRVRMIRGPMIRTDKFLDQMIKIVNSISGQVPIYVGIDIKKKTFIPLLVTQGLMFFDFGF